MVAKHDPVMLVPVTVPLGGLAVFVSSGGGVTVVVGGGVPMGMGDQHVVVPASTVLPGAAVATVVNSDSKDVTVIKDEDEFGIAYAQSDALNCRTMNGVRAVRIEEYILLRCCSLWLSVCR